MACFTSLLTNVILSLVVASATANPIASRETVLKTSLTRTFNASNARKSFNAGHLISKRARINESIDQDFLVYYPPVGVGNPPTTYNLMVDTGSSNTWVGAITPYTPTNTSIVTDNGIYDRYGGGILEGWEYLDQVTIAENLVLTNQSIGVANSSTVGSFDGLDGVLGFGPTDLTLSVSFFPPKSWNNRANDKVDSLYPDSNSTVPTVLDTAFDEGLIPAKIFGIFFQPTTQMNLTNGGEITWGGFDESKFAGDLVFTTDFTLRLRPITTSSPSNEYWGIDAQVTYGEDTLLLNCSAGIVDTGTPVLALNSDAFNAYVAATGAVLDSATNLLKINSTQAESLQSLFFNINGVPIELTPNAQSWPLSLNAELGGDANSIYLMVGDIGDAGYSFILGYTFLERYYTVYDVDNQRVGFAPTQFTKAIIQ
ncbi:hypothetical protein H0H92_014165 [Tricholoma furcatifolium]|nr:hypothetical protein H0H92_014165 [Tricholoma furcatifolium]